MARRTYKSSVSARFLIVVIALCSVFPFVAAGQPADEVPNLRFGSEMPGLPSEALDSGQRFQLGLQVVLDGSASLQEDPIVEVSLRRQDKAVSCVTEIAAVPASQLETTGVASVVITVDTAGLLGGTYEVQAVIRYTGYESSTLDNLLQVGTIEIDDARPELHPIALSVDPAAPIAYGETTTLHATIENTGRLAAGAFHVVFEARVAGSDWETNEPIASLRIPGLARNAETQVSVPFEAAAFISKDSLPDAVELRVRVIYPAPTTAENLPQDQPEELDPNNNALLISCRVVGSRNGQPDLVPLSITFDEDLPLRWDDNMNATVTIANLGGSATAADANPIVRFSYRLTGSTAWTLLADRVIETSLPNEISKNEITKTATINSLAIGTYELLVEVDPPNANDDENGVFGSVPEQNEGNNVLIVGFTVLGTELQVQSLQLASTAIYQGDAVTVRASVINTADRAADEFVVAFYLSGQRFDTFVYQGAGGLSEGEQTYVEGLLTTSDLPVGEYDLRIVVDPDNQIPEYDEANNVISTPITILAPPARLAELHLSGIELDPASPIPEDSLVIATLTLQNSGEIDSGFFHLAAEYMPCSGDCSDLSGDWYPLMDSTGTDIRQLVLGLERGEIRTVSLPFSTAEMAQGSYAVRFTVDPKDIIEEMDEQNNELTSSFTIGQPVEQTEGHTGSGLPNLAFQQLTIEPEGVIDIGDTLDIQAIVVNTGGQAAGPFRVSLHWLTPTGATYQLLSQRVDALQPGQTWTLPRTSLQTALPMGTYVLNAVIDRENEVAESNEGDNEYSLTIPVGEAQALQADLAPTAIRFTPSTGIAVLGQTLLAHVTIQNRGPLASGPFQVSASWAGGSAVESVAGLSPLQTTEISFSIPTAVAGSDTIHITVDSASAVTESSETNNELAQGFVVSGIQEASIELLFQESASVVALQLDSTSGTLYAAFSNGRIWASDQSGVASLIADTGAAITALVCPAGLRTIAYLGTSAGTVLAVDLASGETLLTSESLGTGVLALATDGSSAIYALTSSSVTKLDMSLSIAAQAAVSGGVALGLDSTGNGLYIMTTTAVHAFDSALTELCSAAGVIGQATALAVGSAGVYVGTTAGTVHAFSPCTSYAGTEPMMLESWHYPRTGTLGGAVTSLVLDERDIDPLYVTTAAGDAIALSYVGTALWSFQAASGIHTIPAVDVRSGRLFFGDDSGQPYVVTADATQAFSVSAGQTGAFQANAQIDEERRQTETGTRLVRIYYFGAEDGGVYKFESTR